MGRIALVTGGARRVGRAIARRLARAGYGLALHYHRSESAARELVRELESPERPVELVCGDLSDPGGPALLAERVGEMFERIELVVNNASVYYPTPLDELDGASWDHFMAVNARAPYILSVLLGREMKRRGGGSIVNLLDAGVSVARRDYVPYQVSKAALEAVTGSLARVLAPEVRVNGVAPGAVLLPEQGDETREEIIKRVPMERMGTPEEVAEAVHFAAEGPSTMTGIIITVDGGRSLV